MVYFLLLVRTVIGSYSNVLVKVHQRKIKDKKIRDAVYYIIMVIVAMLYFAVLSGFQLGLNGITALYAFLYAAVCYSSITFNLRAMEHTDVVNITLFSNAGGVIWPSLYGVFFLSEEMSLKLFLGVILVLVSILIPYLVEKKEGANLRGIGFCLLLFLTGGISTILQKCYTMSPNTLSNSVFFFYTNVFMIPFILLILKKQMPLKEAFRAIAVTDKKAMIPITAMVLLSNTASLLSVYIIGHMDLSVYSIAVPSGNIIVTALFARLMFREKLDAVRILCMILAIIAVVLTV